MNREQNNHYENKHYISIVQLYVLLLGLETQTIPFVDGLVLR
jgi:hypothetical protein